MPRILYLLQVHIRSGAEPALLAKLNKVTADSAESVEDVSLVLLAQISGPLRHSLGYVLRHRFRRHGVPGLVINEHAPIKFAEQVVPLLPELLQVRVRRSQRGLILIAVLLARLVSIILLLVRFENSLGPLDDDDDLLVLGVILAHLQLVEADRGFVQRELLDRKSAPPIRASTFLLPIRMPSTLRLP